MSVIIVIGVPGQILVIFKVRMVCWSDYKV